MSTKFQPWFAEGEDRPSRWLVTCDHARNAVPDFVSGGDLGLPPEDMNRHIAYDIGAEGVARELARLLRGACVGAGFSRLAIDPNRGEDDPTLLMRICDGTVVPGNRRAGAREREARLERLHRPYHAAVDALAARRSDTIIVAVHSFTPQLRGKPPRPWHVGVLHAEDERLSRPLVAELRREGDLCVGVNEPYSGHLPGDSVCRHALRHGRPNALLELRNDLIETPEARTAWARRLAPILEDAARQMGEAAGD